MNPQLARSKPDDYWLSTSFVRRYAANNVITVNDNPGCRIYFGACMAALAQGIQYICSEPQRILYAGCGHSIRGSVMRKTFGCEVIGIDYSQAMLDEAEKLQRNMEDAHRIEFRNMNVEALDFPDDSFDVTFTYGLLMSLPDPSKAVGEMMRVSRRGIVGIEECDRTMSVPQRLYWDEVRCKKYPGRVYWHDYIEVLRDSMQIVITPMPTPPQWDLGQPPGYIRYIAVKRVTIDESEVAH